MNLNCDETSRPLFFMEKLKECKKESESTFEFEPDGSVLKSLYVNKVLTTFYVNFEEEKGYTLTVEINIPKIIYSSLEYFHLAVYRKTFQTEDDIFTKYYEMNLDLLFFPFSLVF